MIVVTVPSNPESRTPAPTRVPFKVRAGAVWESVSPWVVGLAASAALWWWNPSTVRTAQAVERLLSGCIDAAAVLAGFQVTALTLLLSIADKPIVMKLRRLGQLDRLIGFHRQAIIVLLAWLVVSLILLSIQGGTLDASGRCADLGRFTRWSSILLTFTMVAAIYASLRVTQLLVKLLRATSGT